MIKGLGRHFGHILDVALQGTIFDHLSGPTRTLAFRICPKHTLRAPGLRFDISTHSKRWGDLDVISLPTPALSEIAPRYSHLDQPIVFTEKRCRPRRVHFIHIHNDQDRHKTLKWPRMVPRGASRVHRQMAENWSGGERHQPPPFERFPTNQGVLDISVV